MHNLCMVYVLKCKFNGLEVFKNVTVIHPWSKYLFLQITINNQNNAIYEMKFKNVEKHLRVVTSGSITSEEISWAIMVECGVLSKPWHFLWR